MGATRILWNGLTGRTGREAMSQLAEVGDVEIVLGTRRQITGADDIQLRGGIFEGMRWASFDQEMLWDSGLVQMAKQARVDVIVDFSHPSVFNNVVELAVRTGKPLICGTSGLSNRQMASLYDATNRVPVFRGGNFRFKVKKFIDEAVELAKSTKGDLRLYENFWTGKELPSETSKVIQRRVMDATGRTVEVYSYDTYDAGNWISDWEFRVEWPKPPVHEGRANIGVKDIRCRVFGFDELAHDVLEIAKVMAKKPLKKGEFYDLDEIWDELPH